MEGNPHPNAEGSSAPPVHDAQQYLLQQMATMIDTALARRMSDFERVVDERISSRNTNNHIPGGSNGGQDKHTDGGSHQGHSDRTSFKAFKTSGAKEFNGNVDPIAACAWIDNTEKTFRLTHCWTIDFVEYASGLFIDSALEWWNATRVTMGQTRIDSLTWTEFKDIFLAQYCPADLQRRYERKFQDLRQGTMTVTAYEQEFVKMSKFATRFISTEDERVRKFVEGLRWEIRDFVQGQTMTTLQNAVEKAREREEMNLLRNAELMPPPKRAHSDSHLFDANRLTSSGRTFSSNQSRNNNGEKYCDRCHRRHRGSCINTERSGDYSQGASSFTPICHHCNEVGHIAPNCPRRSIVTCYECGTVGHTRRECPRRTGSSASVARPAAITTPSPSSSQPNKASSAGARPRAFQITAEEAREAPDVVTGTFLVNDRLVHVLFDSGAIHSFVTPLFDNSLGVIPFMLAEMLAKYPHLFISI